LLKEKLYVKHPHISFVQSFISEDEQSFNITSQESDRFL